MLLIILIDGSGYIARSNAFCLQVENMNKINTLNPVCLSLLVIFITQQACGHN